MAYVYLIEGRADLLCSNCGQTRSHLIQLYYDDDTGELRIEKTCGCDAEEEPYKEVRTSPTELHG